MPKLKLMRTHRNKRVASPHEQTELAHVHKVARELMLIANEINTIERRLLALKKRREELCETPGLFPGLEKVWHCQFCPAQVGASEVFEHLASHDWPETDLRIN